MDQNQVDPNHIYREERLAEIIQNQSQTIQYLMGMIRENNKIIRQLRAELESKR